MGLWQHCSVDYIGSHLASGCNSRSWFLIHTFMVQVLVIWEITYLQSFLPILYDPVEGVPSRSPQLNSVTYWDFSGMPSLLQCLPRQASSPLSLIWLPHWWSSERHWKPGYSSLGRYVSLSSFYAVSYVLLLFFQMHIFNLFYCSDFLLGCSNSKVLNFLILTFPTEFFKNGFHARAEMTVDIKLPAEYGAGSLQFMTNLFIY